MSHRVSIDEILGLPAEERLKLVEAIWDSIAAEPDRVPVSESQKREIESRLEEYRRDPSIAIPWTEARRRIRDRR